MEMSGCSFIQRHVAAADDLHGIPAAVISSVNWCSSVAASVHIHEEEKVIK